MKSKASTVIHFATRLAILSATSVGFAQMPHPGPRPGTNTAPTVVIATPENGQLLMASKPIVVAAGWQNFTDAVAQVQFFADANSLGTVTNHVPTASGHHPAPPQYPFASLVWSNAAAGAHALTAAATDLAGNTVTSAVVNITVVTDLPPVIRLIAPRNGATVLAPANINLFASAFDPDGYVANVTFYAGASALGTVTNTPPAWFTNLGGIFPVPPASYALTWSNAPAGTYALTAVATDNAGLTSTSSAVNIMVVTDLPPVVKIISPGPRAAYYAGGNIALTAEASDPDTTLTGIEFFAGTTSLGLTTNFTSVTNWWGQPESHYSLTWSNVTAGAYALTAVAYDAYGLSATSAPVSVSVVAPPAPSVTIVDPPNGARFPAPANIYIAATAKHFPARLASVQFLSGTNLLGVTTNSAWPTFAWTNVAVGSYSLTAIATDTSGTTATSPAITVNVTTNQPPVHRH